MRIYLGLVLWAINVNFVWANREGHSEDASIESIQTFAQQINPTWLVGRYGRLFLQNEDNCFNQLQGCTKFGCEKCRDGEVINGCLIIACCSCIIPTVTAARCIGSVVQAIVPKRIE